MTGTLPGSTCSGRSKFFLNLSAPLPTPRVDFSAPDGENPDRLRLCP
jgi:hypothetical protein